MDGDFGGQLPVDEIPPYVLGLEIPPAPLQHFRGEAELKRERGQLDALVRVFVGQAANALFAHAGSLLNAKIEKSGETRTS